jgi:hypothetical protein
MKNNIFGFLILSTILLLASCSKTSLDLKDPVSPTISSINSESGVVPFALGMWTKFAGADYWIAAHNHSIMGDEAFIPWGNYGWRWASQVFKITLPDGTVVTNPIGPAQKIQLQSTNSREAGEYNTFQYEWTAMYYTIASANTLLNVAKAPSFTFSGDAATKQKVLKAWAYWWRGWAYSRIGSMYIAGVVNNLSGASNYINNNFVSSADIIKEANANLDSAKTVLTGMTTNSTYTSMLDGSSTSIVPAFCNKNGIPSPDNWSRLCNTMKARNLLVNKKTKNFTTADWLEVQNLASTGLKSGDVTFTMGFTSDGNNDIVGLFWTPSIMLSDNNGNGGWLFCSERLIQEYKTGDARFTRNFISDYGIVLMNPRSRGIQYGTVYHAIDAEDGGDFTTMDNTTNVQAYIAPSYEENELMLAEAKINQNNIDAGLTHVDNVRSYQKASLTTVSGKGLTLALAKEELRRERRVALFLRGTAFYDARRWNVIAPVADGGGRAGANILVPKGYGTYTTNAIRPCFMEYNYMDYFDVPKNELDFNPSSATSVPVRQQ